MRTKLLSLGVWVLVALTATFWGLKLAVGGTVLPPHAQVPARQVAGGGDLHRLFGASAAPAEDDEDELGGDESLKLLGVVWPRGADASPQGVALIAVGDQPARAFRTGAVVQGEQVLLSVTKRGATLGPRGGPADTQLQLPEPSRTGSPVPTPAPMVGRPLGGPGVAAQPGMPAAVPNRAMANPQPHAASPGAARAQQGQSPADEEDDE